MRDDWVFEWRASCQRVIDGDTIDVYIDKGFGDYAIERLRLQGINCPEIHGPTKAAGDVATAFTQAWINAAVVLRGDWPLQITSYKGDSFGRYVAVVTRTNDPVSLNDALLASGNAVVFMVDANPPIEQ